MSDETAALSNELTQLDKELTTLWKRVEKLEKGPITMGLIRLGKTYINPDHIIEATERNDGAMLLTISTQCGGDGGSESRELFFSSGSEEAAALKRWLESKSEILV